MCKADNSANRQAFSLIEVIVATVISMVLIGGLYVAVDLQMQYAKGGRDAIDEGTLPRNLLMKMDGLLTQHVAPLPTNARPTSTDTQIRWGLKGEATQLTFYVTRFPRDTLPNSRTHSPNEANPMWFGDVRRISYWLAGPPEAPLGLAYQEFKVVTATDDQSVLPFGTPAEEPLVIAPEVKELEFSYYDGSQWTDSWDSTATSADGIQRIGPPVAVKIRIRIPPPSAPDQEPQEHHWHCHVVAIPTANRSTGQAPATMGEP